jgi:hypothetical protein
LAKLPEKGKNCVCSKYGSKGARQEYQMTQAQQSALEGLYYVLYETAQNHADNADTDEQTRIIRKEASKFLIKIQKLQKVGA